MDVRVCKKCEVEQDISEFDEHGGGRIGRRWTCRSCRSHARKANYAANRERQIAQVRAWQQANPDRVKAHNRARHRRHPYRNRVRNYGMTEAQLEELREAQGGVCAICQQPESASTKDLSIDHDHSTGRIRGLLCFHCNSALGEFKDDPALLARAIEYLKT